MKDNQLFEEIQEYNHELREQDYWRELEISVDEIKSNDELFHLKEDERCL